MRILVSALACVLMASAATAQVTMRDDQALRVSWEITCDNLCDRPVSGYRLVVNGVVMADVAPEAGQYDLGAVLKPGSYVIAVEAYNCKGAQCVDVSPRYTLLVSSTTFGASATSAVNGASRSALRRRARQPVAPSVIILEVL